jgi:hypothetical protein
MVAVGAAVLAVLVPLPANAYTPPVVSCTITGTARNDVLVGTSGNDVLCGLGGNDTIRGGNGNDTIIGGAGNDTIAGGNGNDTLDGQAGNDTVDGGSGADSINGGVGNDSLTGGAGDDALLGSDGKDNLSAGAGDDASSGGGGADSIHSGLGDDTCALDTADRRLDTCTTDTTAPTISFMSDNPREFSAGSTAVFRWEAQDPSGVVLSLGNIGGPPGWVTWCTFGAPAQRVLGTPESGVYELRCAIPENAPNERYTVFAYAADAIGNTTTTWSPFEFTVVNGSPDNRVPDVGVVRLPQTVEVGESFTVEVDVTDESGTAGVYSWFRGAAPFYYSDQNGLFIPADGPAVLVSGDPTNGTFRQTFTVANWARPGQYSLLLSIRDEVGNRGALDLSYSITVVDRSVLAPITPSG